MQTLIPKSQNKTLIYSHEARRAIPPVFPSVEIIYISLNIYQASIDEEKWICQSVRSFEIQPKQSKSCNSMKIVICFISVLKPVKLIKVK